MAEAKITVSAQDLASAVLDAVNKKLRETGNVAEGSSKQLHTFTESITSMGQSLVARIVEGELLHDALLNLIEVVGEGIKAFPEMIGHTIELGNQLYDMSLKTGASVENLSALRYIAGQTGIDFDSFNTTLYKMEQALGQSGAKADTVSEALGRIGLSMQDLKNEKPDEAFIDIMSALEAIPNRADQAAVGMAIFGRGFKEMAALTQENIRELIQEARDLGLVMTTEQAAAAHTAEIAWKSFSMQIEAAGNSIVVTMLPALATLGSLASESFQSLVTNYRDAADNVGDGHVTKAIMDIGEGFIRGLAAAAGFAEGAIAGLKEVTAFAIRTGEAVVNVGAALIKVGTLGTVDEAGKTILDRTQAALHATYDSLEALKAPLDSAFEGSEKIFASIEQVADGMVGKFGDAYTQTVHKIEDFSARSHQAFGGVGEDVEGAAKKIKESLLPGIDTAVNFIDTVKKITEQTLIAEVPMAALDSTLLDLGTVTVPTLTSSLQQAEGAWQGFFDDLDSGLNKLPQLIERGLTGGGGLSGAFQAFGADVGSGLFAAGGPLNALGNSITMGASNLFGKSIGNAVGAALPGIGAVIGPLAGKLFSAIANIGGPSQQELQGRDAEAKFEQAMGGWQGIQKALLETGMASEQVNAKIQALWASEKQGADAVKRSIDDINSVLNEQKQDQADLQAAVQRYGFSIEELGPAMQKQQLDQQAQQLINDWRLLVASGIDVDTVDQKMAKSMNDYLSVAKKTGQEVPEAMKPILQKMIDQGDLTDENGNKITDLAQLGVKFGETMTEGFQKVVDKLDQLLQKIGMVPAALNAIPTHRDIDVDVHYNDPGQPGFREGDQSFANEGYDIGRPTRAIVGDAPGQTESILRASTVRQIVQAARNAGSALSTASLETRVEDLHATMRRQGQELRTLFARLPRLLAEAQQAS